MVLYNKGLQGESVIEDGQGHSEFFSRKQRRGFEQVRLSDDGPV
jgi:hypothetical protein